MKYRGIYRRRVATAFFLSALIHFIGLLLFAYLKDTRIEQQRFRPSLFLPPSIEAERFKPCPGIWPLAAIKFEDRLLAIAGVPTFDADFPCPSNELYVNTLVYGLVNSIQAGGMLSRYY